MIPSAFHLIYTFIPIKVFSYSIIQHVSLGLGEGGAAFPVDPCLEARNTTEVEILIGLELLLIYEQLLMIKDEHTRRVGINMVS